MKLSLAIAVFCLLVCLTSTFPTRYPSVEMSARFRRSSRTGCGRDYVNDTHICCGGRVHPRGEGPVDCCNGKFFNPSTHVCNGLSAFPKHARKCGPGLRWTNSSIDSEGECQPCPKGYFKSRTSQSDCQRCHKCKKYGETRIYLRCASTQNALCDYPWVWENLLRCARKSMCHSHYKHRRGITRKKMQDKLKRWKVDCGRINKKHKRFPMKGGMNEICPKWERLTVRPTSSPPPLLFETSTSPLSRIGTPRNEVHTTSALVFHRRMGLSNDSVTGPTEIAFESNMTSPGRNETVVEAYADFAENVHILLVAILGAILGFCITTVAVAVSVYMYCKRRKLKESKKKSHGSSCNTLLSNRSSVSSSKACEVITNADIPFRTGSLHKLKMIPCSSSSTDSGYNSYASERATLNKDHGTSESTSLLDENSVPCRESQARPLHIRVEMEQPRCREASGTWHGTSPSTSLPETLESCRGPYEDIAPEQDLSRCIESMDLLMSALANTDSAESTPDTKSTVDCASRDVDTASELLLKVSAKTNCGLSLASEEALCISADENLDGKTERMSELKTMVSVQATGLEREGSSVECIQEHLPVTLAESQMKADVPDPAPTVPQMDEDSTKRRPLSDPLPRGEKHSAAEDGRRYTFPADSLTKLHLRVPLSPDGGPDSQKSDDEEDVDYDEVASTDEEGDAAEDLYNDETSSLGYLQVLNENAATERKPCNIGLITVRNSLRQPPDCPDNIQSGSPISTESADQSAVPWKEGAGAASSSIDFPSQRNSGVRSSHSPRANTGSRRHRIDEAEGFHPTGRNPIETMRTTKIKNTNLSSVNEEGSSTHSAGGSASTKSSNVPRGPMPEMLHLAKERALDKDNLLASYSAEMATQTDDTQGKRDLLGGQWQFSEVFSPEGGVLERENSDIRVFIPKGSVPVATKISGSIHTNVPRLRRKLFQKYNDFVLLSAVAEFHASVPVFGNNVTIEISFVRPGGFKETCFKVLGFTCENNGEITICEVPLRPDSEDDERVADNPEPYYTFLGEEAVRVHTPHFSGYYCVHCKQNITSGLYAVVFGNRYITNQLPRVLLRLYVTDDKIMLKDYREQFLEEQRIQGRFYLDRKEIRLHENVHSRSFLVFLLSPEGGFADQWTFSLRQNGQPRTKNMQLDRLEHMVQCCQKREPAFVEWLLEGTGAQAGGEAIEFECTVDIWNHKVDPDHLDSNPDSFRPEYGVNGHTVLNVSTQKPQPNHLSDLLKSLPHAEPRDQIALSLLLSQFANMGTAAGGRPNMGFPDAPRSVPQPSPSVPQQQRQPVQATPSTQALAELGVMPSDAFPAMPLQRRTTGAPLLDASVNTHGVQEIGASADEEADDETTALKRA